MTAHMVGDYRLKRALTDQFLENFDRWHQGGELFNLVNKELGYAGWPRLRHRSDWSGRGFQNRSLRHNT